MSRQRYSKVTGFKEKHNYGYKHSILFDDNVYETVVKIAEKHDMSVSQLVNRMIKKHLQNNGINL